MHVRLFAGTLLILSSTLVEAQMISGEPTCKDCSVQSRVVAVLEHETLANVRDVFTDSAHRYWVLNNGQLPSLFDHSGRFISVVGSQGPGPKELRHPQAVWPLQGDSVAVVELDGKVVVYTPDLAYARTLTLPMSLIYGSLVVNWPTAVVVSSAIRSEARVGYPLHVVDVSSERGHIQKSFGSDGSITPARRISGSQYVVASSADGGFWTAPRAEHRITQWTQDYRPRRELVRRPTWFASVSTLSPGNPKTAPAPILTGITEDEAGLLWTFSLVPSPEWHKAWSRLAGARGEVLASMIEWDFLYHTRIEVLDPRTGTLLAAHTLDRGVTSVLTGPRGVFVLEDDIGNPSLRVVEFRLVGHP